MALNLNRLNVHQREAVLHGEGPLLILAGAGSGKTSTMAYRIAHLISQRRVPASHILGLSFTKKAAEELKDRVRKLVVEAAGKSAIKGVTITTFHSLCVRILRAHGDRMGFHKDFTILDQSDQIDVLRQIMRHIKVDDRRFKPELLLFEMGQAKNRFMGPEQAFDFFMESGRLPSDYAEIAVAAYPKYQDQLRALNAMDFDDLLFNAVSILEKFTDVREACNDKYRHILVDEYQDTNPAQFKLLRLLTEQRQNLCVVGDDDQSIYAWRGADPTHILEFGHQFKGAKLITLDQNYRSTTTILDAANNVISKNAKRHPKTLWSDNGLGEPIQQILVDEDRIEAEAVAEEILKCAQKAIAGHVQQLRPWKDFAILYRSNPQSRLFEEALRMRSIPYKLVGSMSFLDRKEIKDALSYWRLVVNPKDDASCRRVLNWPARGIGKSSFEVFGTKAVELGSSFFEALPHGEALGVNAKTVAGVGEFRALISSLRAELEATPLGPEALSSWARHSLTRIGMRKAIEEETDDPIKAQARWDNVDELANAIGQLNLAELVEEEPEANGVTALREYLSKLAVEALDEQDSKKDKDKEKKKDQVTLLTFHGAKGLEYPVVFMVGMEEGLIPHRRTIEEALDFSEERRLCYVGITRAKEHLLITRCKHRIRYGKKVPRTPSRFLDEIPPHLIVTRDESSTPDLSTPAAQEKHETQVKDFLSLMRAQLDA